MGKILLVLAILLGAGLYFPESREVIVDTTEPALNPWHRWVTNQQLGQIVEDLRSHEGMGGELPVRRGEFEAWLEDRYRVERSRVDGWGTPYRLELVGGGFRVISAGPDRQFGTGDDLVREGARAAGARSW